MVRNIQKYPIPKVCPYCDSEVMYTSNKEIYGKSFGNGNCYKCTNCDSYVGVHDGTNIPLGRLANRELRTLKKKAHSLFDPTWKNGKKKRSQAYSDLAKKLGIPTKECHFGWFDKEMLEKAIQILEPSVPVNNTVHPNQLIIESIELLKKDVHLTNDWGKSFIKSLIKTINEGKQLSEKQSHYLTQQYDIIKSNATKKGIKL